MFIDTHAHLYSEEFDKDRAQTIEKAKEAGVKKIVLPNIDFSTIDAMMKMTKEYPATCFPLIGLHPTSVNADYKNELKKIFETAEEYNFKGIGEIGIDLYWDKTFAKEQTEAFASQVEIALEKKLPFVIHCRNSMKEIMDVLKKYSNRNLKGIFHCFSGSIKDAEKLINMGFYIGIGGVVTFKNSKLDKVVKEIPLESIVLETDSPYLAPTPYRGKRNESSYIPLIAKKISEIHKLPIEQIEEQTTKNAIRLFDI